MPKFIMDFVRDEEGLTMVEYAVAGSLITVAAATAFTGLGTAVQNKINAMATIINNNTGAGGGGGGGK